MSLKPIISVDRSLNSSKRPSVGYTSGQREVGSGRFCKIPRERGEVALGVRNVQLSVCVASFVAVLRYCPTDGIGEVVDVAELSAERRGVFFDR